LEKLITDDRSMRVQLITGLSALCDIN